MNGWAFIDRRKENTRRRYYSGETGTLARGGNRPRQGFSTVDFTDRKGFLQKPRHLSYVTTKIERLDWRMCGMLGQDPNMIPIIHFKCPSCGNKMDMEECFGHFIYFTCYNKHPTWQKEQVSWIYNLKKDTWRGFYGHGRKALDAWNNLKRNFKRTLSERDKNRISLLQKWRPLIYARDGNKCRVCRSLERLRCHHIKKAASYQRIEESFTYENLITLCDCCHKLLQTDNRYLERQDRLLKGKVKLVCTRHLKRQHDRKHRKYK